MKAIDRQSTPPTANPMSDSKNLVTVAERPTETSAAMLVNVLQDAGIKAVAVGGFTAGFRAEAPGWVQVKTFAADAPRAREVLAELSPQNPPTEQSD